jgi:hypothetical protein
VSSAVRIPVRPSKSRIVPPIAATQVRRGSLEWIRRAAFPLGLFLLQSDLLATERYASRPTADLRIVVLERDDQDSTAWAAIAATGANVVVTARPPNPLTDAIANAAGLDYLAFLTTTEIESFVADPIRVAEARSERRLAGFYYWDSQVLEGFTAPETQRRAYRLLKSLFPEKLVLYPTRLDPIVWSPGFLDDYFRPDATDLVTPYFYPVGATILGPAQESDAWENTLVGLLSQLAVRMPRDKPVLPVLQGFQEEGFPVGEAFLVRQMSVYRLLWPDLSNAAVYAWKFTQLQPPLIEMAELPTLQRGTCALFAELGPRPARCRSIAVIPFR